MKLFPRFGEIYYADLKADGSVQGGCRPVIIASNDLGNENGPTVEIVPLSTKQKAEHLPVHTVITADELNGLKSDSVALSEQVRTINRSQLGRRVGRLTHKDLVRIGRARSIQSPWPLS